MVFVPGADPDTAMTEMLASAEGAPVLVVDQFEELFTLADSDTALAFCRRLTGYASDREPVVVCVRADHLAGLSIDVGFARLAELGLHLVSPLTGDELRAAIEQPAAQAGLRLEAGLVDLLVRDTEGEPGALPLLSHALAETWRRRDGHVLTVDGYRATGGIRGAVARSADRLYDSLPAEQRAMLRGVLLRLVTPSVDGDPVRCRVATATLVGDHHRETGRRFIGSGPSRHRRGGNRRVGPRSPGQGVAAPAVVAGRGRRRATNPAPPRWRRDRLGQPRPA